MGGRRRATRGVLSQNRIRARDDLMRVPSNVGDCIFHLRIVEDSQVYRDLILAIRQFTGYTKRFPNVRGQVPARDIGPDGSTRPEFSSAFMSVVDAFLVERKGGTVFFPLIVPHDANWHNGFIDMEEMPRLVWDNLEDEQDIRVNMARLFEALKLNGLPVSSCGKIFDLEKANLIKSFDTEDCFICGSPAADALVKCQKCRCHFHQQCYAIALMPEDRELWYCRRCTKITDEEESRKAEAREKSHEVEPEDDDPANDNDATNEKEPANDDEPINSFNKLHSPRASHVEASSLMSIFPSKRDNIIILARLNSKDAYRLIDITDVHSLEGLFEACGTAWHIQVKSFYIYLPLNTGVLEILADESASFQLAMKMFQPVPDNDKAVTIRVLVLAGGETYT